MQGTMLFSVQGMDNIHHRC